MRPFLLFILWLLPASVPGAAEASGTPSALKGVLDLRTWDFSAREPLALTGEFEFHWKRLGESSVEPPVYTPLPGMWNSTDPSLPAEGWATYRLRILLPRDKRVFALKVPEIVSTNEVRINGRVVSRAGTVGTTPETSLPQYHPHLIFLEPEGEAWDLEIRVSNFDYRKSGIWTPLILGSAEKLQAQEVLGFQIQLGLLGALAIMALYHLGLFYLRPKDRSSLWFSLFCLVVGLRLISTGDHLLTQWIPEFPWEVARKLEYLPFHLGALVFMLFLQSLFPQEVNRKAVGILYPGAWAFALAGLILPARIMNHLVVPMEIYVGIALGYFIFVLIRALKQKREGAAQVMLGFGILALTVVNDILYANQVYQGIYLMPMGFFFFIFSQAFLLSRQFSLTFRRVEQLSQTLLDTNKSLNRFVPNEFLQYLEKTSILDVKLGDQVRKQMTILFSDIRAFTSLSETMSPEQNFGFLNSYLKRISPLIRNHGGFIDKYVGDAIMALFPGNPGDALAAGAAMLESIAEYNSHRANSGYQPISIGIGIHTGTMMLGTIGDEGRMDTTVISDVVNLASRMESLCKEYGQGIIMAKEIWDSVEPGIPLKHRDLGPVQIRGKEKVLHLVHLSLPPVD